ncbi:hypothetical protein ECTPHS_08888 [Ectothiorhodospira sp. PHS-1]|nr:hypothetical protein ECTPHS_08888 [Ectothiorhodospira sp. PHS-1]
MKQRRSNTHGQHSALIRITRCLNGLGQFQDLKEKLGAMWLCML